MAEKKKNTTNRLGTIPFVILWTLAYGLGWVTLFAGGIFTDEFFPQIFRWFPPIVYLTLGLVVPTFIYSLAQQLLIRWKFAVRLNWWFIWSTILAGFGVLALRVGVWLYDDVFNLPGFSMPEMLGVTLILGYLFAMPAIGQAWVLRKHVQKSWMWIGAAFASAATFGVAVVNANILSNVQALLTIGFAGILQGSVTALTLVWLFSMTRTEPRKRGLENHHTEIAEKNLSETDANENTSELSYLEAIEARQNS